jgi:signal transduction protein with GAF and PtsI domain
MGDDVTFFERGLLLIDGHGDLKAALGELVQLVAESGNCTSSSFYIADWRGNVLKPLVTYGLPPAYVEVCGDVRIGDQCCGRAVMHRKPWIVSDMTSDPLFASARAAASVSPIRAAFSVPVIDDRNECLGSLACHYDRAHTATREEIERNQTWAGMIAHVMSQYRAALAPIAAPEL